MGYSESEVSDMTDERDILTLKQAAEYLQIAAKTLYKLARSGEVPARKIGNRWRFSRRALEEWARGNNVDKQPEP